MNPRHERALEPAVFRRYLCPRGWAESEAYGGRARRYTRAVDGIGEVEVEIPSSTVYDDYARRIDEALEILAHVERRPVEDVVRSLANPGVDIVRFRFTGEEVARGTIGLDAALRFRAARKQLLLSAAHTVVEPLPHFSRLSRSEPVAFIQACRELPPERGSYVSAIMVPVEPKVGELDLEAPFARRVTDTLARALWRAATALDSARDDDLLEHAAEGLSANFLQALAGLHPTDDQGALEVDFAWSANRPPPDHAPHASHVRLPAPLFAPLGAAARTLRETSPVHGIELEGYIARLEREPPTADAPGDITLVTAVDEESGPTKVQVRLSAPSYERALHAHRDAARVRVTGTLRRQHRRYVLEDAGGFAVVAESSDDDG